MAKLIYLISIFLTIAAITQFIEFVQADVTTMERIRKHKEWLRQRSRPKSHLVLPTTDYKSTFILPNLWRFDKNKQNWSINEVYPDNDTTRTTTAATTTTTVMPATATAVAQNVLKGTSLNTTIGNQSIEANLALPEAVTAPTIINDTTTTTLALNATTTTSTTSTTAAPSTTNTTTTTSSTTTTKRPRPKIRPYPRWANWSDWSVCSRSCGGGVMYQVRKCINRNFSTGKRYESDACVGLYKRYQLCNDLSCPAGTLELRAAQCRAHNDVAFQGQRYTWEPYIKDDAECELNCKPLGTKYFATLNDTVIDGTACSRPAEYYRSNYSSRAICVDGICKAIQASGSIGGLYANSGAVSCGGLLCRPVTGIFTRDPLPEEAYVHVATLPAGASNISITELKNSANLLVVRTTEPKYIFNGVNEMSESGAYEAVGSTFDYHRIDGLQQSDGVTEWITCTGPIRDAIELLIYTKSPNPGVKYEYLLPILGDTEENELSLESSDGFLKSGNEDGGSVSSSRSTRKRKFNWKVVGFSPCTKSCGGGTQTPIVRCARENPLRYYSQRRCMHSEKPLLNENLLRCNTQPCPAYWRTDEWGECRCQHGEAYRQRELNCVQELATGIVIHVDKAACMEEQPPWQKQCECPKNRRRTLGRSRLLIANGTQQGRYRVDKSTGSAIWMMSDWNHYCSVDCGTGVEHRTIFCDRSKLGTDRCSQRDTPEITRPCEQQRVCELGEWFAGPWSPCNGNCFNLTRSRSVLCIQNQLITEEEYCKSDLRPQTYEKCSHEEVEYCAPRWHYSAWSECTKKCDGGTQRRSVKCLEYDEKQNALRESAKCRYANREPIFRSCNEQKCEDITYEQLQNDAAPSCMDHFPNCKWAAEAKLCSYDYYSENCCDTCKGEAKS